MRVLAEFHWSVATLNLSINCRVAYSDSKSLQSTLNNADILAANASSISAPDEICFGLVVAADWCRHLVCS